MSSAGTPAERPGGGPVRIAVVAPPWYPVPPPGYGGIERVCHDLVQGLVRRGNDVTLVATGPDGSDATYRPVFAESLPGLGSIESPVQEVRYAAGVAEVLAGVAVDVVHDHSLAGPLLGIGRRAPTVVTAHGPADGPVGDYYRRLGLPIVATSQAQRRLAPGVRWVATVYNGIPVSDFPFRVDKDDYVLFLGRLSPEKGVHLAVEAARAAGVRLVVAGKASEPAERRYLEEAVLARLPAASSWVGEVGGARRDNLLAGARCLLSPIQWEEPFGMVNVEALACGTPVVALNRGSIPEIVTDGRTGVICDRPEQLAEAIGRASLIDPYVCRAEALARFDVEVMVDGYQAVYEALVNAA